MKLAFVLDPLDEIKTYKDSSYAMMEEAFRRGHELSVLHQEDILCRTGAVSGFAVGIRLTGDKAAWYTLGERREVPLSAFDAADAQDRRSTWVCYSTYLLELAELQGARVLQRPAAAARIQRKFSITAQPVHGPHAQSPGSGTVRAFLDEQQDIVLKPMDSMGGASVLRLRAGDPNIGVVIGH
jgi:glutathione synthase